MTYARPQSDETCQFDADPRQKHLTKIRVLHKQASRGLWLLILFLLCSLLAYSGFDLLPTLNDTVHKFLGAPPPAHFISAALFVYIFSAIILVLGRMMEGKTTRGGWPHLGYLLAFYAFYHLAGALEEHFWAVFATGVTVLGLEGYRIWNTCAELIRESEEELARLERWEGFS